MEDLLDEVDASIFGEGLETDLDLIEEYVDRWKRAIESHKKMLAEEGE